MAQVSINMLIDQDVRPVVGVLKTNNGQRFASLNLGSVGVILPGFDADAAKHARAIAAELTRAADEIEAADESVEQPAEQATV